MTAASAVHVLVDDAQPLQNIIDFGTVLFSNINALLDEFLEEIDCAL
ncbi:hypothetical protein [Paraburkholderia sp. C35]|nr:hypothetical protein [Paraburkholderia sp. C35]